MMVRSIFLGVTAACMASGLMFVACSDNKMIPGTDSGGDDATTDQGDMPREAGPDMGTMKPKCPSYPVQGQCDIVAQDCMTGQECRAVPDGGGFSAQCVPENNGTQPKGGTCKTSSDCVPGTECQMGRCSPYCCMMGDDTPCGMSPDQKPGICNLTLVDPMSNKTVGMVCTYSDTCKPFGAAPCPMGSTCLVQDMSGLAKCTVINPSPGKDEGKPCSFANECKDGLYCLGTADGGSACAWACYLGGGPFDAGIKSAPPGQGGCPAMESCKIMVQGFPSWLGACSK